MSPYSVLASGPVAGVEGAVVVGKLLEGNANPDYGYNAANNTYTDLVKSGIIDPLKVGQHWPLCSVLHNSVHCVYCHSTYPVGMCIVCGNAAAMSRQTRACLS